MSSTLEQAKANLDKELDEAHAEIIKRWKVVYEKGATVKKLVKALKDKHA